MQPQWHMYSMSMIHHKALLVVYQAGTHFKPDTPSIVNVWQGEQEERQT